MRAGGMRGMSQFMQGHRTKWTDSSLLTSRSIQVPVGGMAVTHLEKAMDLTRSPNSKADLTAKHPHRHTRKNVESGDWTLISQAS